MIDERILKELLGDGIAFSVRTLVDSTNSEAKRMAVSLAEEGRFDPVLITANEQSAGRGRMGRSFLSRADRGIYMSLLYFTDKALPSVVSVTTATAAIVAEEIERFSGNPMRIKWVNDIYNDRGKVSGILVETLRVGERIAVVVGIGINIGEDDFPEELRGIASAIGEIGGKEEMLISGIAKRLLDHAASPESKEYMAAYRKRFMLEGESVDLFRGGEPMGSGRVVGVDDDGGLLFIPDGESEMISVHSGEVSIRKAKKEEA